MGPAAVVLMSRSRDNAVVVLVDNGKDNIKTLDKELGSPKWYLLMIEK